MVPIEFPHPFASVLYTTVHCWTSKMTLKSKLRVVTNTTQCHQILTNLSNLGQYEESGRGSEFNFRRSMPDSGIKKSKFEGSACFTIESFLFPDSWGSRKKEVTYEHANELLERRCNLFVKQFNKMRDSYKELYRHLKKSGEADSLSTIKLDQPKMELDYAVFIDDEDTVIDKRTFESEFNANIENYFDEDMHRESLPKTRVTKSQANETKLSVVTNAVKSEESTSDIGKYFNA